jgi:WD40 repeat protein
VQALLSAWKDDGTTVFSGGCDKLVKLWPLLSGGQATALSGHEAPVKQVAWICRRSPAARREQRLHSRSRTTTLWRVVLALRTTEQLFCLSHCILKRDYN